MIMKMTRLCDLLGIQYPVIQAPMDWITDAVLAAAVSNGGGLGVIGPNAGARTVTESVLETGERLRREIRKAKSLTNKPFGVNLVALEVSSSFPEGGKAFSDQCFKVMVEEGVPVAVLVGNAPETYTTSLKEAGIKVLHRAMPVNVAVAKKAQEAGVDALVAVGFEAGGHSGSDCIPNSVLIPQIVDALRIPVVAGGGIADGRGMIAALAWGAAGIYMGTRFIATTECPAHENVKQAIIKACDLDTIALPGTLGVMRALRTTVTNHCAAMQAQGASSKDITDVYHGAYLKGMLEGDSAEGTFAFGDACGLIREIKDAGSVVRDITREAEEVLSHF